MSKILLTSALPYANGSIHLGHMVEHVQSDIFARFKRSMGADILFVCADDTHGTAIELRAETLGITPEELIAAALEEHTADFRGFRIDFDEYYTTHSPENQALSAMVYERLRDGGHIVRRTTQQLYSAALGRFLSDRMVKGTCPKCGTADQYGDVCESCGSTYDPTELIAPYDIHTKTAPELRETENLYVRLTDFAPLLREWMETGVGQEPIRNFVRGWLDGGLDDWCITRAAPYFGFPVPGEPDKYFYVWLDAPIGYIAATQHACERRGGDWRDFWSADADAEIHHNIGKDIVYFHTLFWPAMLHAAGLRKPSQIHVHGMLTVNGRKMSKSRGTFVNARTYLEHLDPDYLRYYYAAKLGGTAEDIDLNTEDFVLRVNAELVNNVVNLCSRVTKFCVSRFGGHPGDFDPADYPLCATIAAAMEQAKAAYEAWDTRSAIRAIVEAGNEANVFFQDAAPWVLVKEDEAAARRVCAVALHAATSLVVALAPVTPGLADRLAAALGVEKLGWDATAPGWRPPALTAPDRLLDRIDPAATEAMMAASVETPTRTDVLDVESFSDLIPFDTFAAVDLRVGVVDEAHTVEGADKLLRLIVHCGKQIQVFAGVRKAYPDPSVLVGRRVVVVANLQPRKMRFGTSEGMLLATSGPDDVGLQLVHPDPSTLGGWTVR
ncbi:MAG: methionine--tRNA ligase [Myxococcales bacterium]|nr:methionine--tRNA ligase [Myxococcales bacterium]MCB9530871.1 methionine--tRNA ligase [Myxococcales bacterium]MCB9534327.1 methionine--tRNA ligase [Myxococcales bacterium]